MSHQCHLLCWIHYISHLAFHSWTRFRHWMRNIGRCLVQFRQNRLEEMLQSFAKGSVLAIYRLEITFLLQSHFAYYSQRCPIFHNNHLLLVRILIDLTQKVYIVQLHIVPSSIYSLISTDFCNRLADTHRQDILRGFVAFSYIGYCAVWSRSMIPNIIAIYLVTFILFSTSLFNLLNIRGHYIQISNGNVTI